MIKKKNNIFENKLQELNKLKVDSKEEVLAKEQKERDEKKKLEEYCEAETRKYLKGFDKERSDLKKFIKVVNNKFYKKYEMNIINPFYRNTDGSYCKETGGYSSTFFIRSRDQFKRFFEANIFSIDVLGKTFIPKDYKTSKLSLSYKYSTDFERPSHFKVELDPSYYDVGPYLKKVTFQINIFF